MRWTVVATIAGASIVWLLGLDPHLHLQEASGFTAADYAKHVRRVRRKVRRLPGRFTIVVQPPFVVVGDERPATVRRRARRTVKWAVDLLKKDYFTRDPGYIITIWLFRNERSYRRNTITLFRQRPGTPFGFYSETYRALVMNISTGGGTLVHEIVHPFVEANFPACPPWFNEGLGSLYEQSGHRKGKIWGFTNWRLPGLQRAIRAKALPSFKELTAMNAKQFYERDRGTNYGQARYLLYYLQVKGLLRRYYHQFVKHHGGDPTGYRTLQRILGARDMRAFQREWEAFVLRLRYP
jgi:hypothetical protein